MKTLLWFAVTISIMSSVYAQELKPDTSGAIPTPVDVKNLPASTGNNTEEHQVLRPHEEVKLKGVEEKFSGSYEVEPVRHTITGGDDYPSRIDTKR